MQIYSFEHKIDFLNLKIGLYFYTVYKFCSKIKQDVFLKNRKLAKEKVWENY